MLNHHPRRRALILTAAAATAVNAALARDAAAGPFTTGYTDGGSWNTIYAQGFSPSLNANPNPGVGAGDTVLLDQFQFFKSGNTDSAADVRLVILNNIYANLQGLTTASPAVVGLSNNTVASTAPISIGAPITFDFDNLELTYGANYGAVLANIGPGGEVTPVLVSALVANYVEVTPGDWHPQTNYGTESDYQYTVSNYINTDAFGSFFAGWTYAADANFTASLLTPNVWNAPGGGNWSGAGNWLGEVPNAASAPATFGSAATVDATVTTDVAVTAGSIVFDNGAASYTVTGGNAVTLDVTAGLASIKVRNGSHAIAAPLALADDTLVRVSPSGGSLTLSNLQPTAANLTKSGAGTLVVNNLRAGDVNVQAGAVAVTQDSTAAGTSKVAALSIAVGAKLDIKANKLITTTPVGTGTAGGGAYTAGSVSRLVQTASNSGAWDGSGLTTSMSDATGGLTSLGVALASDVRDFGAGTTLLFGGQTITPTSTLVMYTYAGDANLDGQITGDDYSGIDFSIQDPNNTGGWFNGDFNYDGFVSGDDYSAIDFNILAQGAPFPTGGALAGVTAVPEPASAVVFATASFLLAGRRRRRAALTPQI